MKKLVWWGIQLAWALACVLVLVWVIRESRWTDAEHRVLFVSTMLILSAPAGYLVLPAASTLGLAKLLGLGIVGDLVLTWFLLVLIGWLQWFFALPRLIAAIRDLRNKRRKVSV